MEVLYYFLLFAFLVLLFKFLGDMLRPKASSKLPAGPWKLPIVGSLHHLLLAARPHSTLRDLAKVHGPLMHLKLGEISTIVVSSPEVAEEVLKTHEISFADRPRLLFPKLVFQGHDIIFAPYGDYWRQMRKLFVQELLSVVCVRSFSTIRAEEVSGLVRSITAANGSLVNITEKLDALTNDITLRSLIGTKYKHQDQLLAMIKEGFSLAAGFYLAELFPSFPFIDLFTGMKFRVERCCKQADRIMGDIIQDRRESKMAENNSISTKHKEENLLDVLLRLQDKGGLPIPLTDDMIKAVLFDLIAGGTETTSTTMTWALSELMRSPKVMHKAQAEIRDAFQGKTELSEEDAHGMNYLQLVMKETLRMHPPGPLLPPRECREECEILGYRIPIRTRIVVNAWAMGIDPKHWKDADQFTPERFYESNINFMGKSFEYIPFGAGRRICPGIAFGLASMELPLAQLLYYFDWKLPNGIEPHKLDMTESIGLSAIKKTPLCLHATPYIPNPMK